MRWLPGLRVGSSRQTLGERCHKTLGVVLSGVTVGCPVAQPSLTPRSQGLLTGDTTFRDGAAPCGVRPHAVVGGGWDRGGSWDRVSLCTVD